MEICHGFLKIYNSPAKIIPSNRHHAGKGIKPHDWDHGMGSSFDFSGRGRWNAGGQKLAGKELFCKMTSHTEQVENMRFDELIWNFII